MSDAIDMGTRRDPDGAGDPDVALVCLLILVGAAAARDSLAAALDQLRHRGRNAAWGADHARRSLLTARGRLIDVLAVAASCPPATRWAGIDPDTRWYPAGRDGPAASAVRIVGIIDSIGDLVSPECGDRGGLRASSRVTLRSGVAPFEQRVAPPNPD